jgi:hypothetical protein
MPFYPRVDVPEPSRRCTSAWGASGGVALGREDEVTAAAMGAIAGSPVDRSPTATALLLSTRTGTQLRPSTILVGREDAKTSTVKQVVLDDFTRRPYFVKSPISVARCASTSVVSVVCRPLSDRAVMRYLLVAGEPRVTT